MNNDNTAKVQMVKEGISLNAQGQPVKTIQVTYTIGAHGPFTADFDPKDFTADKVRQVMQAQAQVIQQIT